MQEEYRKGVEDALNVIRKAARTFRSPTDAVALRVVAAQISALADGKERKRIELAESGNLQKFVDGLAGKVVEGAQRDIEQEALRYSPNDGHGGGVISQIVLNPIETKAWVDYALSRDMPGAANVRQVIDQRGVGPGPIVRRRRRKAGSRK